MSRNDIKVGAPVWASVGDTGWRSATVLCLPARNGRVAIEFADGSRGTRRPENLRTRNPKLAGRDKPPPSGDGGAA